MEFNINIWDEVVKWLHENGKFTPEMLTEEPARNLIGETNRILSDAVHLSITEEVPPELTAQLEQNTYVFSAFKGFHNLKEASLKLTNEKGGIKPFETFKQDVLKVHKTYNVNYLESEYNFAVQSAQMAVKWADYVADGDRYYLQYRTAGDGKVRAEHAALHGTTLPVDDPFWDKYFPPLGWNCRCTTVQVRKDKYPVSDSATAMQAGNNATSGKKQQMFRFNPGKEGKIFPPKHPYLPKGCEGCKKNGLRLRFGSKQGECNACDNVDKVHDITSKLTKLHTAKGPAYNKLLKEICESRIFKPVEGLKDIYWVDSANTKEANNLKAAAKKLVDQGYKVYILPNPNKTKTPDFILVKKGVYKDYDLKTITGKNSVGNRLSESVGQSNRVVLNMTTEYNPRSLAKDIQSHFESNKDALEIMVLKGKKNIEVNRKLAEQTAFIHSFMRKYTNKK